MVFKLKNVTTPYRININVEFGQLETIMNWCRDNCYGKWSLPEILEEKFAIVYKNSNEGVENHYCFEFESETDYLLFNLKFK